MPWAWATRAARAEEYRRAATFIEAHGVEVVTDTTVTGIEKTPAGLTVTGTHRGEPIQRTADLVLVVVGGLAGHQPHAVVRAVLAGLALGAFYLVLVVLGRGSAFGLGDAKLAPTIGVLLGFFSWAHVIVGTFLAFLLGAVYGAQGRIVGVEPPRDPARGGARVARGR